MLKIKKHPIPCIQELFLLLMIIIFLPEFGVGDTIRVPADYTTIQTAIDSAADRDTILVSPGTYNENLFIEKSIILLSSAGPESTIIDAENIGIAVILNSGLGDGVFWCKIDSEISGFTIRNGNGGGFVIFRSCVTITNCLIINNEAWAGGGISLDSAFDVTIDQVTVSSNTASQYGGGIFGTSVDTFLTVIRNSIIWGNDPPMDFDTTSHDPIYHKEVTYTDYQMGWPGEGNINEDPIFVDPQNGNYQLQEGSPCIDAGDPSSPLDPDSTRTDMGAFYFDHTTHVIRKPSSSAVSFSLFQNHPNPFNPVTKISYYIPRRSDVSLAVYNIIGEEVARLVEKVKSPGNHYLEWDASGMASGIYLCRLRAGDYVQTQKMLLLR